MNMLYNKNRKRRKETERLKKRIFVLLTAVAMLGFVLVGCGSEKKEAETTASTSVEASAETGASAKREVKMYTYNDGTYGP